MYEFNRTQLKADAKTAFKENYWLCVAVCIVSSIISTTLASASFGAATLLVSGPLTIGMYVFFIKVFYRGDARFEQIFTKGFVPYGRKLGGYLWMQLFIFLWSLLFVIPGIIKSFEYAMTPYILGDCPNVKAKVALKLSMRMMKGHKAELFVLGLSFLGWLLLSACTFGILYIFYVGPYIQATMAGYYGRLKTLCLEDGTITLEEIM